MKKLLEILIFSSLGVSCGWLIDTIHIPIFKPDNSCEKICEGDKYLKIFPSTLDSSKNVTKIKENTIFIVLNTKLNNISDYAFESNPKVILNAKYYNIKDSAFANFDKLTGKSNFFITRLHFSKKIDLPPKDIQILIDSFYYKFKGVNYLYPSTKFNVYY